MHIENTYSFLIDFPLGILGTTIARIYRKFPKASQSNSVKEVNKLIRYYSTLASHAGKNNSCSGPEKKRR